MTEKQVAVVVGTGPGLGDALVARFAEGGMSVAAISRKGLVRIADEYRDHVHDYACDATNGERIAATFARITAECSAPDLVVFNVGTLGPRRHLGNLGCAVRAGLAHGLLRRVPGWARRCRSDAAKRQGTIIFTGATASIRGSAGFAHFAVPKFGLRALAQSMARELGPKGIHVAHVIIDGMIESQDSASQEQALAPVAIAEAYYQLRRQHRSVWTHDLDLRPAGEKF